MKVLILSVTTGFGHHATAGALAESLKNRGAEVEVVDIYEKINRLFQHGLSKGYLMTMKYLKTGYRVAYRYLEKRPPETTEYSMTSFINTLMGMKFSAFIDDYAPDVVICTHPFAAQLVNEMKRRDWLAAPVVGIVTDYTLPPIWADVSFIEYIVLPSEVFLPRCKKRGISEDRVKPLGIPVRRKFSVKIPKDEARRRLNLRPDSPVVLIMSGSMGYGNIKDIAGQVHETHGELQLLVVCGTNKVQYEKLMPYHSPDFRVFSFVDNIDEMMDAADCIITKPGGLTISEALAKELPMILLAPIPGHEERNVEFLLNGGMALRVTKTFPVDEAIYQLYSNPERIRLMEESIRLYHKPNASDDLAAFVMSLQQ